MMRINFSSAILAGVLGAAVMSIVLALCRLLNVTEMNLEMMLGAMFTQAWDLGTWLVGLVMHLAAGAVFAIIYAVIFEAWRTATVWLGVLLGVAHTIVSGSMMVLLPAMHPAVPEVEPFIEPGFMAINFGLMSMLGFVALHLIYGGIIGGMYHLSVAPREARTPAPHRTRGRLATHIR